jgi:ankyrin repeat protein
MIALRHGHKDIVTLLLKARIDVRSSNLDGEDALVIAAQSKQDYAIPALIKAGSDVNHQDRSVCSLFVGKLPCIMQHSPE